MTTKLATTWTKGLDPEAAKDIRQEFIISKVFRDRLVSVLNEKIDSKRKEVRNANNYDKPHWDKYLADSIGYERGLEEVISLLSGYVSEEK